jgi:hypothetical protein
MKAKYHPKCLVMEAPLGRKPSFAWRNISSAQPMTKNGLVWRVDNGRDINIWGDIWLPTPTTFAILTPRRIMVEQARVDKLIDPTTKSWNLTLIIAIFQEEAQIISSISLSPLQPKDHLIWRGTKNGKFTMRSAYYLEVKKQGQSRGESLGTSSMEKIWKMLWSLAVPNSVKVFIWKACNNVLPTKENLFRRTVVDNTTCPICERDEETFLHAL